MKYRKKNFLIEDVFAKKLATKHATPLYCYSYEKIRQNVINFKENFKNINPLICFFQVEYDPHANL